MMNFGLVCAVHIAINWCARPKAVSREISLIPTQFRPFGAGNSSFRLPKRKSGILHGPPSLFVNLCGGDVLVIEEILNGFDRQAGIQQQRCGGRAEGVWGVKALLHFFAA